MSCQGPEKMEQPLVIGVSGGNGMPWPQRETGASSKSVLASLDLRLVVLAEVRAMRSMKSIL